jgi:cbb3-type cytochrome oxidase subunit 3
MSCGHDKVNISTYQMLSKFLIFAALIYLAIRLLALILLILRRFRRHEKAIQETLSPDATPMIRVNEDQVIRRVTLPDECF